MKPYPGTFCKNSFLDLLRPEMRPQTFSLCERKRRRALAHFNGHCVGRHIPPCPLRTRHFAGRVAASCTLGNSWRALAGCEPWSGDLPVVDWLFSSLCFVCWCCLWEDTAMAMQQHASVSMVGQHVSDAGALLRGWGRALSCLLYSVIFKGESWSYRHPPPTFLPRLISARPFPPFPTLDSALLCLFPLSLSV